MLNDNLVPFFQNSVYRRERFHVFRMSAASLTVYSRYYEKYGTDLLEYLFDDWLCMIFITSVPVPLPVKEFMLL